MSKYFGEEDNYFKTFAISLEKTLRAKYPDVDFSNKAEYDKRQKYTVDTMCENEELWKAALRKYVNIPDLYMKFAEFLSIHKHSFLSCRPYFRERKEAFSDHFMAHFTRERIEERITKFRVNFKFIDWAHQEYGLDKYPDLLGYKKKIEKCRTELAELSLPLVISRAKIFWKKTPKSHLEYMDLIQIAVEGLLSAIDKFVPPYTPVFRSVILGRISGCHISEYSATMLHFFPRDRQIIYRANKFNRKTNSVDELVSKVNEIGVNTDSNEVQCLQAASSHVFIEPPIDDGSEECPTRMGGHLISPIDFQAEIEEYDATIALRKAVQKLELVEQKVLALKGIPVYIE